MEAKELRGECLRKRRELPEGLREAYSREVCRRLSGLPGLRAASVIFSYQACWDEADLSAFHQWARSEGKTLAFPSTKPGGLMEALSPLTGAAWTLDRYGIRSPSPEASRWVDPEAIDAIIAPCVGFDGTGNRLGHGAGYYDRYFPRCPNALRVLAAFEAQRCQWIQPAPWDVPADVLVTESGVWECSR